MTLPWLWLAVVFLVRALFRRDPVSFGRRCCELALGVVTTGLPAKAKYDWLDEAMDHVELEIWEGRKGLPDAHIGARLVWQSVTIMIHGWADRQHYREATAARRQLAGTGWRELIRFSDTDLIAYAAEGDRGAFGILYERYVFKVFRHIYYLTGDLHTAEDLTAQTFLKALEAIHRYEMRGVPFLAWLLRIGYNLTINHRKVRANGASPLAGAMKIVMVGIVVEGVVLSAEWLARPLPTFAVWGSLVLTGALIFACMLWHLFRGRGT